ncbi:hypothetical protein RMATCC62417_16118 [Rhizopus microsporus]|nr:hypothetical protein RMATCC62417_16118 [Rhizopus microsporus]
MEITRSQLPQPRPTDLKPSVPLDPVSNLYNTTRDSISTAKLTEPLHHPSRWRMTRGTVESFFITVETTGQSSLASVSDTTRLQDSMDKATDTLAN